MITPPLYIYNKNPISFRERPASSDELLIADVMQKYLEAFKKRDSASLLLLFSEDAQVYSRIAGGKMISKKQYAESVLSNYLPHLERIFLKDLLIRLEAENAAIVCGFRQYIASGTIMPVEQCTWRFKKENGQWLINEAEYHRIV